MSTAPQPWWSPVTTDAPDSAERTGPACGPGPERTQAVLVEEVILEGDTVTAVAHLLDGRQGSGLLEFVEYSDGEPARRDRAR